MEFATTSENIEVQPDVKIHAVRTTPNDKARSAHEDALTLVFLHFWGGSTSTWSQVIPQLANSYRTLALDFRGWGRSTGPDDQNAYSIKHLADDVEAVISHYNLRRVVIVGHSMGAKVAQLVTGRNRVAGLRGLFLVAPAPPTPLILPNEMREQQLRAYDSPESAEFVARNVLSAGSLSDAVVDTVVIDMLKGNQWAKLAWPQYGMAEDIHDIAREITAPVYVIVSDSDSVETPERVKKQVLPNVGTASPALVVLPRSGHLMPLEDADGVASHITLFLTSLE
ncbi:Alpha/Beta hydrolase protein [Thelonectria olida]|uniref:Alpha/Beta hydrolase protein n=1 Tax=Thelonectria olida TaxID=1576542 RepID=A0A9P9ANZ5_9HYPO|nr:Alpha/Beta hydrolase protein [Thelonectria olida]